MIPAFQRMSKSILTVLGEDALFDGAVETERVNIENGVQMTGMDGDRAEYRGDMIVDRDIATVLSHHRQGDKFVQNGVKYRLENMVQNNGVNKRFIIMEIPV